MSGHQGCEVTMEVKMLGCGRQLKKEEGLIKGAIWWEHQLKISESKGCGEMSNVWSHIFYYTFQSMEEAGILERSNGLHLFALHFTFLPRINRALQSFVEAWNLHPVRTERNWTPEQISMNGMIDFRNRQLPAVADVVEGVESIDDFKWFGFDPQAPHPGDDGMSTVVVDDVDIELPEDIGEQLSCDINPLAESNSFGIDLYVQVLEVLTSHIL